MAESSKKVPATELSRHKIVQKLEFYTAEIFQFAKSKSRPDLKHRAFVVSSISVTSHWNCIDYTKAKGSQHLYKLDILLVQIKEPKNEIRLFKR